MSKEEKESGITGKRQKRDEVEQAGRSRSNGFATLPQDLIRSILLFLSLQDALGRWQRLAPVFKQQLEIHVGLSGRRVFSWALHFNPERKEGIPRETEVINSALRTLPNLLSNCRTLDFSTLATNPLDTLRAPVLIRIFSQCYNSLETLILPQYILSYRTPEQAFGSAKGQPLAELRDSVESSISTQIQRLSKFSTSNAQKIDHQRSFLQRFVKETQRVASLPDDATVDIGEELMSFSLGCCKNLQRLVWADWEATTINPVFSCLRRAVWPSLTELQTNVDEPQQNMVTLFRLLSNGDSAPALRHLVLHSNNAFSVASPTTFPVTEQDCKQFSKMVGKQLQTLVFQNLDWPNANAHVDAHLESCKRMRALVADLTALERFAIDPRIDDDSLEDHFRWERSLYDAKNEDKRDALWKIVETVVQQNPQLHTLGGLYPFLLTGDDEEAEDFDQPAYASFIRKIPLFERTIFHHKGLHQLIVLLSRDAKIKHEIVRRVLVGNMPHIQLLFAIQGDDWRTWTTFRPERSWTPPECLQGIPLQVPVQDREQRQYHIDIGLEDKLVRSWPWNYGDYPVDVRQDFVDVDFNAKILSLLQKDVVRPIARIPNNDGKEPSSPWQVSALHPSLVWDSKSGTMTVAGKQPIPAGTPLFSELGFWMPSPRGIHNFRAVALLLLYGAPADLPKAQSRNFKFAAYTPFFAQWSLQQWNDARARLWGHLLSDDNNVYMFLLRTGRLTSGHTSHVNVACKVQTRPNLGRLVAECFVNASRDIPVGEQLYRDIHPVTVDDMQPAVTTIVGKAPRKVLATHFRKSAPLPAPPELEED